jgi:hypothetical protein
MTMNRINRKALAVLISVASLSAASAVRADEALGNWSVRKETQISKERRVPSTQVIQGHNVADDAFYDLQNGGVPAP